MGKLEKGCSGGLQISPVFLEFVSIVSDIVTTICTCSYPLLDFLYLKFCVLDCMIVCINLKSATLQSKPFFFYFFQRDELLKYGKYCTKMSEAQSYVSCQFFY